MGWAQEPRLHRAKPLRVGKEYLHASRGLNDSQLPFCPTKADILSEQWLHNWLCIAIWPQAVPGHVRG